MAQPFCRVRQLNSTLFIRGLQRQCDALGHLTYFCYEQFFKKILHFLFQELLQKLKRVLLFYIWWCFSFTGRSAWVVSLDSRTSSVRGISEEDSTSSHGSIVKTKWTLQFTMKLITEIRKKIKENIDEKLRCTYKSSKVSNPSNQNCCFLSVVQTMRFVFNLFYKSWVESYITGIARFAILFARLPICVLRFTIQIARFATRVGCP